MCSRLSAVLVVLACLVLPTACAQENDKAMQGYVEGEFVSVAAPLAGELERLDVARGRTVARGDPLFALESAREAAALAQAEHELRAAGDQLADLEKGSRPPEIASVKARLAKARSAMALAGKELERRQSLLARGVIAAEELDQAATGYEQQRQLVRQAQAELATARLGGRADAVAAARSRRDAARAAVDQARWNLDQKRRSAPMDALVHDTLYRPGEYVAAARPVVTLLPPGNVKVRFFVPEPGLGGLAVGRAVRVLVDGLEEPVAARVTFVSTQAEYTPPVIYSSQSRAKLVFMVEAAPDPAQAGLLHPGQPVDVFLEPED